MCKILLSTILLSLNSKLLEALLPHALYLSSKHQSSVVEEQEEDAE